MAKRSDMDDRDKSMGKEREARKGGKPNRNFHRNPRKNGNWKNNPNPKQKGEASNDPEWYAQDAALLRDAATLPFSFPSGVNINLHNPLADGHIYHPGVMTLRLTPAIGWSTNPSSAVNVASTAIYTWVRHVNSGRTNYDAPDLMLYLLSMAEVYSYIVFLQRIYACATYYSAENRNIPSMLLTAQNVDATSIQSNLADFRYGINLIINKAAALAIPAVMHYFNRKVFLYRGLYTEGTSIKDQLYMYTPNGFWQYQYDADGAGCLRTVPLASNNILTDMLTYQQLLDYGNSLIDPIYGSEDMKIMAGDILHAYGDNIIKISPMDTIQPISPVFDIVVLEQFKNATVCGGLAQCDVLQDSTKGWLTSTPLVFDSASLTAGNNPAFDKAVLSVLAEDRLLTTTTAYTDPNLVIENSRLMAIGNFGSIRDVTVGNVTLPAIPIVCGTEIALFCVVYTKTAGITWKANSLQYSNAAPTEQTLEELWTACAQFKFQPAIRIVPWTADGKWNDALPPSKLMFDLDNFAQVSYDMLWNLHDTALYSMLHSPFVAKVELNTRQ